jgi:hypothetical protein
MKRIRYKKNNKGLYESVRTFISNQGHQYKVYLDLENMNYKIKNLKRQEFIKGKSEKITNKNVLKRTAKKHLKQLGVEFDELEIRDRTFGLCEKGHTEDKQREVL